jgi:pyridoxal phosphate enzyme (YggS family)
MSTRSIDPALVADRVEQLRERILAGAPDRQVRIMAVTKGFGPEAVLAAQAAGLDLIGENYAQEMVAKAAAVHVEHPLEWHFLGRLQRNKVRSLVGLVHVWQSIDRVELIDELARRSPGTRVFIQANLSGESQKGGVELEDVPKLVQHARSAGLSVEGLMGVGPEGPAEHARSGFRSLVRLADDLQLPERSIGMTGDLEVAVQEGSTMIRVGSGLFGPRPPR